MRALHTLDVATKQIIKACLALILLSMAPQRLYSQSFGLGFYGDEVHQDKRTALDLSPGKSLCFKNPFEVGFDMTMGANQTTSFGYIVRIIENDHNNIDLIHSYDIETNRNFFKLVIGNSYSKTIEVPKKQLFENWNHVRIKFDVDKSQLVLYLGKQVFSQAVKLANKGCYKVLFGANSYHNFQTTDVPSMIISNIYITEANKLKYKWQLNDYSGTTALEDISEKNAGVTNPQWIKKKHYDWTLTKSFIIKNDASVAFDEQREAIYVTGKDSVFKYTVLKDSLITYRSANPQFIIKGMQSLYIPQNNQLFDINVDRKQVAAFDFKKQAWDKQLNDSLDLTGFYHCNKFYSSSDTSIYIMGGYGFHKFKNTVQRYHIPTKTWTEIKTTGSFIRPRYLGALGAAKHGAYTLGGYGSVNGEQSLNPVGFYSLNYFDPATRAFKKVYDLDIPSKDMVFANSMVINEAEGQYYALLFNKNIYNSKLQLITGSLQKPEFKQLGSTIPYIFQDTSAFADLFYSKKARRFIAIILNHNKNNTTKVSIYSLSSPPIASVVSSAVPNKTYWIFMGLGILLSGAVLFVVYYKKRRVISVPNVIASQKEPDIIVVKPNTRNAIFLFGDFQVFSAEGDDLTKYFTPLIKELFLVVLIYTICKGRGISSEKLEELLWSDKTSNSAHSNRAVNISRLKTILEKMDTCTISKDSGYWKIDSSNVFIDYAGYQDIINDKENLTKQKILDFIQIIHRGVFLPGMEFEWLDAFKAEITNEIIDVYLEFASSMNIADDPKFLVQLTNDVFNFDPVNEDAMVIRCKALSCLGKHSLAKTTFENFSKEYETIYGEQFQKSFKDIVDSSYKTLV